MVWNSFPGEGKMSLKLLLGYGLDPEKDSLILSQRKAELEALAKARRRLLQIIRKLNLCVLAASDCSFENRTEAARQLGLQGTCVGGYMVFADEKTGRTFSV